MNKRVFIGQFVSEAESYKDKRISQAGNNYQLKFIEIIKPFLSISIVPTFFELINITENHKDIIKLASKSKSRIVKILSSNLRAFKYVKVLQPHSIWFYNITTANFLIFLLLKFFTKFKIYFIVADYHTSNKYIQFFFKKVLSSSKGCIVLNSKIGKELGVDFQVLPGIINDNAVNLNLNPINNNILFSGSLGKTTGFELALEFAYNNPEFNLYISGRPFNYTTEEFKSLLTEFNTSNIRYLGLLSYDEYLNVLNECTFALSLRNPLDVQHDYNFPSKILEYQSKGLIVISSKHYDDISDETYFVTEFTSENLLSTLSKIQKMDNLENFRRHIFTYVRENFTSKVLLQAMSKLENKNRTL